MKNIQFSYSEDGETIVNANISFEASLLTIAEPLLNALQEKLANVCKCNGCNCQTPVQPADPCAGKYFDVTCEIPEFNSVINGVGYPYDGYIKPVVNIDNATEVTVAVQMFKNGLIVAEHYGNVNTNSFALGEITNCVFASDNCPHTGPEFVKCDNIQVKISNGCCTKTVKIKIYGDEIVTIENVNYVKVLHTVTVE